MTHSRLSHAAHNETAHADGRRERSRSSRSRIVAALLDLVGKGDVSPSAAQVADLAGVGLRTVFRHFEDMDSLYREMSESIEVQVLPTLLQPPAGETWKDKLANLSERRARVFEAIMPYRISASLRRFESPYLMQDYRRMLRFESESIEAHLPGTVRADRTGVQSLVVILGFQTWRSLRRDQDLSVKDSALTLRRLLDQALAAMPED